MTGPRTSGAGRRKRGRLSRSGDFDRVYRQGRSTGAREFVVHVFPREASLDPPRVGLSVSKKVGDSVTRNRIKRVLRESVATLESELAAGSDLVITARVDVVALDEREGQAGVQRELRALLSRTTAWAGGAADAATAPSGDDDAAGAPSGAEPAAADEAPTSDARPDHGAVDDTAADG